MKVAGTNEIVIVPEEWIQDLCQENLRNYGSNNNQPHLVYINRNAVDEHSVPIGSFPPNFGATLQRTFNQSTIDEMCLIATQVKFYGEYSA